MSIKPLLTPDAPTLVLVDYQPQMSFAVGNIDVQTLINNAVGLTKTAKIFGIPTILTTVAEKSFSGPTWKQLTDVIPEAKSFDRTSMNFWEDKAVRAEVERIGRKTLILGGLWTTACINFPTIQLLEEGYSVYVVADAMGDVSQAAHDHSITRMVQAGAVPVTWLQVLLELQRDWARQETYDAVTKLAMEHAGAYGVGIQYAKAVLGADANEGKH
ncbi:hydrolase [Chondromyces crocatus]|uniref:Hydrolase n=1 Tax=Chondromyces crocatus TaxID=52 RepID=A0A0K1ELB6_CHOCO|nr:hydrolase [Chondromyces crocatus]AKT41674.1 hydrolase [Chondromyces crocatus]